MTAQVRDRLEHDLKDASGTSEKMDDEPGLPRLEERIAYNIFRQLVGQGGMSPGRVPRREMHAELDARGYDREADRASRYFLLHCWSAIDGERMDYLGTKLEESRKK